MPFNSRLSSLFWGVESDAAYSRRGGGPDGSGAGQTLLLSQPTISEDHLAFVYAGDIWVAKRDGSQPRRLTSHPVDEANPKLSPDGQRIAFEAGYDGNMDVFVIATSGGQPRRLTWHPGNDRVDGWTPDGTEIVFSSAREVRFGRAGQIHHVSLDGGFPRKIMEAPYFRGAWSPDGKQLAYLPNLVAYNGLYGGYAGWRGYRGGSTGTIYILDTDSGALDVVPSGRVNDINPMWLAGALYFISDRTDRVFNIFKYDLTTKEITQLTWEDTWDIRSASGFGTTIVYEAGGWLKELDIETGGVTEIEISIKPDLPQLRSKWKNARWTMERFSLSPTGKRALVAARGEIFTVPIKDGSTRNLTNTSAVRELSPLWSPKGTKIAYISSAENRHRLVIADQKGARITTHELGAANDTHCFYLLMYWMGGGQRIIYRDNQGGLFAIDTETGAITRLATFPRRSFPTVSGSPDGRWLAFTHVKANLYSDLMLHDFETGRTACVSDGMVEIGSLAFCPDGKYLYFAASINVGPRQFGFDMTSFERPARFGLYVMVLAGDGKSPLLPGSGDEGTDEEGEKSAADKEDKKGKKDKDAVVETRVDLAGIETRIDALPVAERAYDSLAVAADGSLFYIERVQPGVTNEPPGDYAKDHNQLVRFDFKDKKSTNLTEGVLSFSLSANGEHIIFTKDWHSLYAAKTEAGEDLDEEHLDLSDLDVFVNPREEWVQIFDEAWRMVKGYFYDSNLHGIDWQAIYDRYRPLVAHVGRREDLTELLLRMSAEMHAGHFYVWGGDVHHEPHVPVGLLGADFRVENGAYRIKKIYGGEKWNPFVKAPLAAPGLGVKPEDYILAVNGRPLDGSENIFARFEGQVGKQVTLTVNGVPGMMGARDIVVEPVASEDALRRWAWVEENRAFVDRISDGRVGYVYVPDTGDEGYHFFNRMFFPQADKDALIIDERCNGGGQASNYMTDVLSRTYLAGWKHRDYLAQSTPGSGVYGPKVMLIDQDAGSGGDFFPYSFRRMNIGKLIGTRTWGGLIGIGANPLLIDGGIFTVPFFRFFSPEGEWRIENEGIEPDIEVGLDPIAYNEGRDTQLERALEEVLEQLKTYEPVDFKLPPPPPTDLGH